MRSITPELTPELLRRTDSNSVASGKAYPIHTYRQLVEQVAKLSFLNKDYLLFFRGQSKDYKSKAGATTLYPIIYRGDYLSQEELNYRFKILNQASHQLKQQFSNKDIEGNWELCRKKYIQWGILQHYQVCSTPLLDITHSLWVACSFAQIDNRDSSGYIFVFGLPYVTNRISINSEHDLVNIRLLSISPPEALRPHFQEGYLAGTEDITNEYESKTELDFKNRLIAKFRITNGKKFWGSNFDKIPRDLLYPSNDRVEIICREIRVEAEVALHPDRIGEFIKIWSEIEEKLIVLASRLIGRPIQAKGAIDVLYAKGKINIEMMSVLHKIRKFRNDVVHKTKSIEPKDLRIQTERLKEIDNELKVVINLRNIKKMDV